MIPRAISVRSSTVQLVLIESPRVRYDGVTRVGRQSVPSLAVLGDPVRVAGHTSVHSWDSGNCALIPEGDDSNQLLLSSTLTDKGAARVSLPWNMIGNAMNTSERLEKGCVL